MIIFVEIVGLIEFLEIFSWWLSLALLNSEAPIKDMLGLLILVRLFEPSSVFCILLILVRSRFGNKKLSKGNSLSMRFPSFFLIMDFSLYSYDFETAF